MSARVEIHVGGGPQACGRPESLEQGQCSHVARSHRDASLVERLGHGRGRVSLDDKGEDRHSLLGTLRADQPQSGHLGQSRETMPDEVLVVLPQRLAAQFVDEGHGGGQANRAGDVGGAGLKLLRAVFEGRTLEVHVVGHIAADVIRRHRLEQFAASPHHAGAHRTEHLVPREHVEVAAEVLDIDRDVRGRLRPVDDHAGAGLARERAKLLRGIHESEDVGHMAERDQPRPHREHLLEFIEPEPSFVVDVKNANGRARAVRRARPGHEVGVVFGDGQDDLVARAQVGSAPGARDQVDAFGRPAHEHDLAGIRRVDEPGDDATRRGEPPGGAAGEVMDRRGIGVVGRIELDQRVDHGARAERRRGAVEIGQRLAVHALPQGGKRRWRGRHRRLAALLKPKGPTGRTGRQKLPSVALLHRRSSVAAPAGTRCDPVINVTYVTSIDTYVSIGRTLTASGRARGAGAHGRTNGGRTNERQADNGFGDSQVGR